MWREKLYFCSPRALSVLGAGTIMFFYESKARQRGRGDIVAVAQVVRTALLNKSLLDPAMTRRGVLTADDIEGLSVGADTALVYFSQLMCLKNPVGIPRLRKLGCMDGSNFITARPIEEASAWAIIEEGQPSVQSS